MCFAFHQNTSAAAHMANERQSIKTMCRWGLHAISPKCGAASDASGMISTFLVFTSVFTYVLYISAFVLPVQAVLNPFKNRMKFAHFSYLAGWLEVLYNIHP